MMPGMPVLRNAKREAFARHIARSPRTGWPQSRCYRESGYATAGNSAEVNACRLLRDAQVMNRISEIVAPAVREAEFSVERLLIEIEGVLRSAKADRAHGACVSALALVLRVHELIASQGIAEPVFGGVSDVGQIVDMLVAQIVGDLGTDAAIEIADRLVAAVADRAVPVG